MSDESAIEAARARLEQTDPRDAPLLQFWRELLPDDFDFSDSRRIVWLDYELSGIERGRRSLERVAALGSVAGRAVLDIGAGNGGLCIATALSGAASVSGIEFEASRIQLARKWAQCRNVEVEFRQGVAEKLPFADASFDVVFLSSVIEHVQDQKLTIREMSRVLRPGGLFFLDGPNRLSPHWLRADPHYGIPWVSAMPNRMGRWWVVDVRKVSPTYDVGVFPIYSSLVRRLRRHGLQALSSDFNSYAMLVLTRPSQVNSAAKRALLNATRLLGVNALAAAYLRDTLPSFAIVGRKSL